MRKNKWWLMAFLIFLFGCTTLPLQQLIDKPKIQFENMFLENISLFEATPVFKFKLTNSNPMGINVDNIKYNLKINDQKFVKGVSTQKVRIPAAGSGFLELPVTFNYMDVFETLTDLGQSRTARYDLTGSINIGPFSVPYQTQGKMDIPVLPEVRLKDVRVENLSLTQAGISVLLELKNSNAFTVNLSGLNYALSLAGKEVVKGMVKEVAPLVQNGKVHMEIPVNLNLFKLGRSMYQLLNSSGAGYDLSGQMVFDVPGRGKRNFPFKKSGQVNLN